MKRRQTGGFTLIELLLVVVIIGILAAMVVPRLAGKSEEARIAKTQADITTLSNSLSRYEMDTGTYPATEEGLGALLMPPASLKDPTKWKGPYIESKTIPQDAWKQDFVYTKLTVATGQQNTTGYDLYSLGPNGAGGDQAIRKQ